MISRNLNPMSIANRHDAVYESLSYFQALRRGQAEHPENQIIVIPFRFRRPKRLFLGRRMLGIFRECHGTLIVAPHPVSMISSRLVRTTGRSAGSQAWNPGLAKRASSPG